MTYNASDLVFCTITIKWWLMLIKTTRSATVAKTQHIANMIDKINGLYYNKHLLTIKDTFK